MKNLKNINVAILAVVMGFGLVITQSAFTAPAESRSYAYWQFDSNQLTDARNYEEYTIIEDFDEEEDVNCDGSTLPCILKVDASIDQPLELDAHLMGFADDTDVVTSTPYKKN